MNLVIRAYSKLRRSPEPIILFRRMIAGQVKPDDYTLTFVVTSCELCPPEFGCVANSLIGIYAVLRGWMMCAVFDEMPERDVFSWTSLVSAYAKNG
ncbi:hypothetical protein OROGR_021292 [Orobanche gracilis]